MYYDPYKIYKDNIQRLWKLLMLSLFKRWINSTLMNRHTPKDNASRQDYFIVNLPILSNYSKKN